MKKLIINILTWSLVLSFNLSTFGQNVLMNTATSSQRDIDDIQGYINNRIAVTKYEFVNIDVNSINKKTVTLQFFSELFRVTETKKQVRSKNNFSWFAKSEDEKTTVIFSVIGKRIHGYISNGSNQYSVETLNNKYVVEKIDQSKFPLTECSIGDSEDDFPNTYQEHPQNNLPVFDAGGSSGGGNYGYNCKIRVLVLYTPTASNRSGNIGATIQNAVDLTNQSFVNSEIDLEIELVYAGETDYQADNSIVNDVLAFADDSDNQMDEVHELRKIYAADICVLIEDVLDPGAFGRAKGIKATSENAFAVADYDAATNQFTFAHEIGHIVGLLHQSHGDLDPISYEYGHGFKVGPSLNSEVRTIMATPGACGNCNRVLYWSNPDITYSSSNTLLDGSVMGTSDFNDCAKAWRETESNTMHLNQPENNVIIKEEHFANQIIGDVIAKNSITTDGSISLTLHVPTNFRAKNSISFKPGFNIKANQAFSARIANINDCGTEDDIPKDIVVAGEGDNNFGDLADMKSQNLTEGIFPNPVLSDKLFLNFHLEESTSFFINILNMNGQILNSNLKQQYPEGSHQISISINNLSVGLYILEKINAKNGEKKSFKFIVN